MRHGMRRLYESLKRVIFASFNDLLFNCFIFSVIIQKPEFPFPHPPRLLILYLALETVPESLETVPEALETVPEALETVPEALEGPSLFP